MGHTSKGNSNQKVSTTAGRPPAAEDALALMLRNFLALCILTAILFVAPIPALAGGMDEYEGRLITSIEVVFEGSPADPAAQSDLLSILKIAANNEFSAVRVRESLQALFDSGRVANARVEVVESPTKTGPLRLRFVIQRQVQIGEVRLELGPVLGTPISEDELRARLNLVQPGTRLSKQIIVRNADEIQIYLRDRGYFNASVEPVDEVDSSGTRAIVTYRINPGEQSRVGAFIIEITGFDTAEIRTLLRLQPNAPFTREALGEDVKRIKEAIIASGYLAPQLNEPRVERDAERNLMTVTLKGAVGPKVKVNIPEYPLKEKTKRELLPVMREGNIDVSAIEEGARRLRNRLQEEGYFFT